MGFTCSVCGRFHEEEPRDIRMTYPEPVARLADAERERRVVATDDFCTFVEPEGSERHFARGLLEIPIPAEGTYFGYGAWVELARDEITRLASLWRDPMGREERPFAGTVANELAPYVATEGLPATLTLRDVALLPRIDLEGDHPIVRDSRRGISVAEARRLAEVVVHTV